MVTIILKFLNNIEKSNLLDSILSVTILVNGKKIAYGEVVVVDENFGVKITGIVSGEERVRSLGK